MKAERDRLTHALRRPRPACMRSRRSSTDSPPDPGSTHFLGPATLFGGRHQLSRRRARSLCSLGLWVSRKPPARKPSQWGDPPHPVRIDAARTVRGLAPGAGPLTNGLSWMIDRSIGLGSGKMALCWPWMPIIISSCRGLPLCAMATVGA